MVSRISVSDSFLREIAKAVVGLNKTIAQTNKKLAEISKTIKEIKINGSVRDAPISTDSGRSESGEDYGDGQLDWRHLDDQV